MIKAYFLPLFIGISCLFSSISTAPLAAATKEQPICGKSVMTQLTQDNYDDFVSQYGVIVVEFYSNTCGPCIRMKPIYKEVATELSGQVLFGKVLKSKNPGLAFTHKIKRVPTFILYRDGVEIKRRGSGTKQALKEWIESEL